MPESETKRGAHHALAKGPAGLDLGQHRQSIVTKSVRAIAQTSSDAIIISSEALEGILDSRKHAEVFFGHIRDLNFEPKLVLFPRNQPQWMLKGIDFAIWSPRSPARRLANGSRKTASGPSVSRAR